MSNEEAIKEAEEQAQLHRDAAQKASAAGRTDDAETHNDWVARWEQKAEQLKNPKKTSEARIGRSSATLRVNDKLSARRAPLDPSQQNKPSNTNNQIGKRHGRK